MWVIIGGAAFLCFLISSIGGMAYGIWWFINVYDPEMKKKLEPDESEFIAREAFFNSRRPEGVTLLSHKANYV